ncbi:hypothetical protein UC35_07230 [Ramlibacter tataouinensis]|uniref:Uncharacterized protein n=2 Tax=Ramlibacter tataouinensis TaxID=94132 RepID=A0A127JRX4_9BURK|nr:hypothetical protein UC35_07230 [Ramlibacter tataouinensis]
MDGVDTNRGNMAWGYLVVRPDSSDLIVKAGRPADVLAPAHLYTYVQQGSCASLGPPAIRATRRVLAYSDTLGFLTVSNTVPGNLDKLRTGPHALTVRSAPADGNKLLYCGDLRLT